MGINMAGDDGGSGFITRHTDSGPVIVYRYVEGGFDLVSVVDGQVVGVDEVADKPADFCSS
ncbi:hypothetical protein ACLI1Q_001235 [Corynebacterium sp. LaCa191]|uniref:hypothetical protein n=1 Tax=Corynebacterium sp. LaCa191 TaxID=3391426 RepID=UPI0039892DEC